MTNITIITESYNLGTTFPVVVDRQFNNISYKFYFDLNTYAVDPFLVLRVRKENEEDYIFQNKLLVNVTQHIDTSIKILPIFIKILFREYGDSGFRSLSILEEPNQIVYITKVRDLA